MSRINLRTRLERLNRGFSSDTDYDACIVSKMANMPAKGYLKAHKKDMANVFEIMSIPEDKRDTITYRELAFMLHNYYTENPDSKETSELLLSLSKPMTDYYEYWREKHERQD